jgi:hypothetical protein
MVTSEMRMLAALATSGMIFIVESSCMVRLYIASGVSAFIFWSAQILIWNLSAGSLERLTVIFYLLALGILLLISVSLSLRVLFADKGKDTLKWLIILWGLSPGIYFTCLLFSAMWILVFDKPPILR